jgi:hypothetical protein
MSRIVKRSAAQAVKPGRSRRDVPPPQVWIDAIALPDLFGPDAREFPAPRWVKDRCA